MEAEYKFTDRNHKPVPQLKVGDICYIKGCSIVDRYGYSKCEVRRVEVKWVEPNVRNDEIGHWSIAYYLRENIDIPALKSTLLSPFSLNECGGHLKNLYLTPHEIMEINIENFKRDTIESLNRIRKRLLSIGYTEEDAVKMLESK